MGKKVFCIAPAPLLLQYVSFVKFVAFLLLIFALIYIVSRSILRGRKKELVKDRKYWIIFLFILFFIVIVFSPIFWNSGLYLLLNYALPIAVVLVGAIVLKKYSLLDTKMWVLIILSILFALFVGLFVFSLMTATKGGISPTDSSVQQKLGCGSGALF